MRKVTKTLGRPQTNRKAFIHARITKETHRKLRAVVAARSKKLNRQVSAAELVEYALTRYLRNH